jgi:hypothetical protein
MMKLNIINIGERKLQLTKFMHTSEIVQQVIEDLPNISKHEPCRYVS